MTVVNYKFDNIPSVHVVKMMLPYPNFLVVVYIAVVFGLLSILSLVSILVPRVIGYVILGIAWLSAAIFLVVFQGGRLIMDPVRWIYNKFIKPVFTKTRNWFNINAPCFHYLRNQTS